MSFCRKRGEPSMNLNTIFDKLLAHFEYNTQSFSQLFEISCRLGRLNDIKPIVYANKVQILSNEMDLYPLLAKICLSVWSQVPVPKLPDLESLAETPTQKSNLRYILSLVVSQIDFKRQLLIEAYQLDNHNISVITKLLTLGEKVSLESLRQLYRVKGLEQTTNTTNEDNKYFKFVALGGGNEVGASAYYIEINDCKILVDFGVKFEGEKAVPPSIEQLESLCDIKDLDAILLTHAHLDHCGGFLELYKRHPYINVIMTPDTQSLMRINMRGLCKDEGDQFKVEELMGKIVPLNYNKPLLLKNKQLHVEFFEAGHILGAASILLRTEDTNVFVTGDFCLEPQGTTGAMKPPEKIPIDILISESTYGSKKLSAYQTRDMRLEDLNTSVEKAILNGKSVLISGFALGRCQELLVGLLDLAEKMQFRIYIDGLAIEMTKLYNQLLDGKLLNSPWVHPLSHQFHSTRGAFIKNEFLETPCCVITSSGMLNEGSASAEYAKYVLPNENALCILTGYQAYNTLGDRVKRQMQVDGKKYVNIEQEMYPIKCDIQEHSLSAHPSIADILALTSYLEPNSVILVHGDAQEEKDTLLHQALKQHTGCAIYQSINNQAIYL